MMFLYKSNRVYLNNISFCIPDNVFLKCNCEEYDNCLELIPVGEDCRIIIFGEHKYGGAKQFFSKGEAEACYSSVGVLQDYRLKNKSGYLLSYSSSYNDYTEIHFDTDDKNGVNMLGILIIRTIHGKDNSSRNSNFQAILQQLNIE